MITYFKRSVKDKNLRRINKFEIGSWINAINPTKREIDKLSKEFNLDKQNLLSGLDEHEVPRVEFDEGVVYIILKTISKYENELSTILIVLSKNFILTLSKSKPSFIEEIEKSNIEFITTQKLKSLIKLFSLNNKEFERKTLNIVKLVSSEKKAVEKLREEQINNLLKKEDILNSLVSSYYYTNAVYNRIIKKIKFYEEDKEIIEDLIIETTEGFNLCKSSLKTISNIRNNLVILMSNRLNRLITLLTILTVFLTVPASISGLYGMNLVLPLQQNPFAFFYIIGIIFLIWIAFIIYFKKKIFF